MKFSRELSNEQQADARELALRGMGYLAWRTHKADGTWQVFWMADRRAG